MITIIVYRKEKWEDPAKEDEDPSIPYWRLYTFASGIDWLCILIGVTCSIVSGLCMLYFCLEHAVATKYYIIYASTTSNNSLTPEELQDAKDYLTYNIFLVAMHSLIMTILTISCEYLAGVMFCYSCSRQMFTIRQKFLERILILDIGWYDKNRTGEFANTFTENLSRIEDGIGEKVTHFIYYETIFLVGIISSLVVAWKLTLICCISLPVSIIIMGLISWISNKYSNRESEATSASGAIAEEVFSAIRTVISFEGQKKELKRYSEPLIKARNSTIWRSFLDGITNGCLWFFVYAGCAASFYFGIQMLIEDRRLPVEDRVYDAKNVVTVINYTFISFWMFSNAGPYFHVFGTACGAARKVFKVLNSEPKINSSLKRGMKLKNIKGDITFSNVYFRYPTRQDVKVLNGVSLRIAAGESVAFVGASGSGKSTCIQLLQRFYDPISGEICIDNNNIKDLNLFWIRSKIGLVSQEPVLFATTISENIRYGKLSATQEDIERAAKKAKVHQFIKSLPNGYETIVGERGTQLSGGQKQRIAIARALVRNPSILLLDEATSALDTTSEAEVQAALDSVCGECTTIIVAHRLSTVRNANRIFVLQEGKIVEQGSYQNLIDIKGAFYELVKSQGTSEHKMEAEAKEDVVAVKEDHKIEPFDRKYHRESYLDMNKFKHSASNSAQVVEQKGTIFSVLEKNKPEGLWILIGCISSLLVACSLPTYSIIFGDIIGAFATSDNERLMQKVNEFCLYILILAVATGCLYIIQMYSFGVAAGNLTLRMRIELFTAIMKQEIGWFDRRENSVGALCSRLSGDTTDIQGASGLTIGTILLSISTLVMSNVFAICFHWKLALMLMVFVPFIFVGVYYEQKILKGDSDVRNMKLKNSAGIAVEAIGNIRTVASLGCEKVFLSRYTEELMPYMSSIIRKSHSSSLMFGVSKSLFFCSYAAGISYGAKLMIEENTNYGTVLKVCELVITGSFTLANAFAFAPNLRKGLEAAGRTFSLFDRVPEIKNVKNASKRPWEYGNIEYSRVYFSYPTRPNVPILRGLDLNIFAGKTIALVGSSGCGKSTIIQLLERFYEPTAGAVCIDDVDIGVMDTQHLRAQFALVSQEPNLFDRTIAENIAYGNNQKIVPMAEIIKAAKDANIHEFISSLPLAYETRLGSKGAQLSGGQKQRIAIARALIRNPRVLLLDEATSALDNESEKIVQEALDNAKENRTCFTIAHRLTTVKDADCIFVLHRGKVVESGRHQELIDKGGHYHEFYKLQTTSI
ncbi:hypothetical protein WA026_005998 [Henosepilachna vigintioctopunctata]|uniref:ABC-type xenobiotic transporter n=1 Tax=Henosepilachna vigintioctopunctata TaxID=420089 RepID=A0AAW1U5Q5_9CUCU